MKKELMIKRFKYFKALCLIKQLNCYRQQHRKKIFSEFYSKYNEELI